MYYSSIVEKQSFCCYWLTFCIGQKIGTGPASDTPIARAKLLSYVGQFVTELNVPTVLTQQAQELGVAAIKNNGNQIFQIYWITPVFLWRVFCVAMGLCHMFVPYLYMLVRMLIVPYTDGIFFFHWQKIIFFIFFYALLVSKTKSPSNRHSFPASVVLSIGGCCSTDKYMYYCAKHFETCPCLASY